MRSSFPSDLAAPVTRQRDLGPLKLLVLLLAGMGLASGRYDWAGNPVALRAYTLSGFFFCLVLTGIYANFRAFGLSNRRVFWPGLTIGALALNLPYRWLGIDGLFYLKNHPFSYGVSTSFTPEWLAHGHLAVSWTATNALIFASVAGAAIIWAASRPKMGDGRPRTLFLLLLLLMAAESWMHLSNRSPYSYIPHFQQPPAKNSLYNYKALPGGLGVVNADFEYFTRLEELFQGNRPDTTMLLVRRSFIFYLSSHLSYFIGYYRAFLVLNLLLWLAATVAMYFLCRDLTGSDTTATSAAGFMACGPGFIMYAAQPMAYLPGYAMLAITVFLYHRHIAATRLAGIAAITASGILLGLTMLAYDTFAWTLFFIGYALLTRTSLLRATLVVILGALIYASFLALIFNVFKFAPEDQNDRFIGEAARHILGLARHPQSAQIFPIISSFFGDYAQQIVQVTFYVPIALAAFGLFLVGTPVRLRAVALLLLLPSVSTSAFFHFGQSYLARFPRFSYAAYPGIVLLAAAAVGRSSEYFGTRGRRRLAWLLLTLPFVASAVLANLDAFGLMPHLYYHFYFTDGGFFDR